MFFPVQAGDYPPVFFVGGLDGLIPSDMYTDVLSQLASHGFVVFGVDPRFPFLQSDVSRPDVGADVKSLFVHLDWVSSIEGLSTSMQIIKSRLRSTFLRDEVKCTQRFKQRKNTYVMEHYKTT